MEAVWKRLLILLLVGVLLTILAFPIVRGEETDPEEVEDPLGNAKNSTRIKEVYFGPVDSSNPADGRPDLYEYLPEVWVFTFLVLEGTMENNSGAPVTYGIVWLNFTMGPYFNTTRSLTDIRGRVHFNFTSRFTDTITGNTFTIPTDVDRHNLTLSVEYQGNETYHPSLKIRNCTYRRYPGHGDPPNPRWFQFVDIIIILFIINSICIFFLLFILPIVGFSLYIKKNLKTKIIPHPFSQ